MEFEEEEYITNPSVNQYIDSMFMGLKSNQGYIDTLFDAPLSSLDPEPLWRTFSEVARKEILQKAGNDVLAFADYDKAVELQTAIAIQWPVVYYLEKLVAAGIVHRFEQSNGDVVHAVKELYKPILNAILMAEEVSEGS